MSKSKIKSSFDAERNFGQSVRANRAARGISLTDLAGNVKVSKGYLSRLELGKTKPSRSMVQRIAAVLQIDRESLLLRAGYLTKEIRNIFYAYPSEAPVVLRETFEQCDGDGKQSQAEDRSHEKAASWGQASAPLDWQALYDTVCIDCFEWLDKRPPKSIHAIVTDPPYGLREYSHEEKVKLRNGKGGVWRIPPTFDGCTRSPLPRFTVLTRRDKERLRDFFFIWGKKVIRVLVPGAHVFIATNPLVSQLVYMALIDAGFEKRGEIIRLVQTLRGGDRPKNAHLEFNDVTVMPRSCFEPWGLFRKPCEGRVQDNLRKWKTGGLCRISEARPFCDIIKSAPARGIEREIAPHPSLKPQGFMREIVRAALPFGEGIILDPFMGAGSTIAAACAASYRSVGLESDPEFYAMAVRAIPKLARFVPNGSSRLPGAGVISSNRQQDLL